MKRITLLLVGLSFSFGASGALGACLGDDQAFTPADAGTHGEAGIPETSTPAPTPTVTDAGIDTGPVDSGQVPRRVLLNLNGTKTSEVVAFNLETNAVDGRYVYPASFGTTFSRGAHPYVLEQRIDVVARMDDREPWKARSTWNVATPTDDGGYSDPAAVVPISPTKAYVLRFNKNQIMVFDPSVDTDGGLPAKSIDLSAFVQAGDTDGVVEPTSAVFVPSKKRVYVLLDNIDLSKVAKDGFSYACSGLRSSIMAIDTDTDLPVSLGGASKGGAITLYAHNSPLGVDMIYDGTQDRLVVLGAGCNEAGSGTTAGPVRNRYIEELRLGPTLLTRILLDLNTKGFPQSFTWIDPTRAILGFYGEAYLWDPRASVLGPKLAQAPDTFAFDGKDGLVGVRTVALPEAGSTFEVVRAPFSIATSDAGPPVKLGSNPFALTGGFLNGTEMWPRP